MRSPIAALVSFLLIGVLPTPSRAQQAPPDLQHRKVRFIFQGTEYQGTVVASDPERLILREPGIPPRGIPWSSVMDLEVSTRSNKWRRGAVVGGLSGGVLLGLMVESFDSCFLRSECDDAFHGDSFMAGFGFGAGFGAGVGALAGLLMTTERWEPVIQPPMGPASPGWRLGIDLRPPRGR